MFLLIFNEFSKCENHNNISKDIISVIAIIAMSWWCILVLTVFTIQGHDWSLINIYLMTKLGLKDHENISETVPCLLIN